MTCLSMGYLLRRWVDVMLRRNHVWYVPITPKCKIDLWLMTQWLTNYCAVWCQRACRVVVVVCSRYFMYTGRKDLLFWPVWQTLEQVLCMYHGKTFQWENSQRHQFESLRFPTSTSCLSLHYESQTLTTQEVLHIVFLEMLPCTAPSSSSSLIIFQIEGSTQALS